MNVTKCAFGYSDISYLHWKCLEIFKEKKRCLRYIKKYICGYVYSAICVYLSTSNRVSVFPACKESGALNLRHYSSGLHSACLVSHILWNPFSLSWGILARVVSQTKHPAVSNTESLSSLFLLTCPFVSITVYCTATQQPYETNPCECSMIDGNKKTESCSWHGN